MSSTAKKLVRFIVVAAFAVAATMFPSTVALADKGEQFTVPFSGDQVVPGPGDPDGAGGVFIAMGKRTGTFCFFADTANISTPLTAVHLHRGVRGEVGEEVVQLHGPSADPDVSGCHRLDRKQVKDISKYRENYYIDIHNEEYPDGALRGQLG